MSDFRKGSFENSERFLENLEIITKAKQRVEEHYGHILNAVKKELEKHYQEVQVHYEIDFDKPELDCEFTCFPIKDNSSCDWMKYGIGDYQGLVEIFYNEDFNHSEEFMQEINSIFDKLVE